MTFNLTELSTVKCFIRVGCLHRSSCFCWLFTPNIGVKMNKISTLRMLAGIGCTFFVFVNFVTCIVPAIMEVISFHSISKFQVHFICCCYFFWVAIFIVTLVQFVIRVVVCALTKVAPGELFTVTKCLILGWSNRNTFKMEPIDTGITLAVSRVIV